MFQGEPAGWCCDKGLEAHDCLPQWPRGYSELLEEGEDMSQQSTVYNRLFCMTAVGVAGTESFIDLPRPSNVKIHGKLYHWVLTAEHTGGVQWYLCALYTQNRIILAN